MLVEKTRLYCCKVYKNGPHAQRSDFQGIQDMNELRLGYKFQHDRVCMRRQRQHLQKLRENIHFNYIPYLLYCYYNYVN
jgi:hypothetical protein